MGISDGSFLLKKNKKAPARVPKIDTPMCFYHVYGVKCHFVSPENIQGKTFLSCLCRCLSHWLI